MKQVKNRQKQLNAYVKYSGLALQMGVALFITAWIGRKLDAYFGMEDPVLTLVMMLLGLTASMVMIIRSLKE